MARIKINDLPKDMKINNTELRRVFGGGPLAGASPKKLQEIILNTSPGDKIPIQVIFKTEPSFKS